MDTLEDSNIKDVWTWQFPKRRESAGARLALMTLIGIIGERSGASNPAETAAAAQRFGIPIEEWNEFDTEL